MSAAYPLHRRFFAPALRAPELWRLALGIVIVAAVYLAGLAAIFGYVWLAHGRFVGWGVLLATARGATPGGVLILLWSFAGVVLGAFLAVRMAHGRSAATLFGAPFGCLVRAFVLAGLPVIAINAVLVPAMFLDTPVTANISARDFLLYLPFALPALLVQVGAEELVFRGYLQQQLAARFGTRFAWMAVPSLLFALLHYMPLPYPAFTWLMMAWAFCFGLVAADLTARTGNLGAAIGLHFANNAVAFFTIGVQHNLDGLALWSATLDYASLPAVLALFGTAFGSLAVYWLAARLTLRV